MKKEAIKLASLLLFFVTSLSIGMEISKEETGRLYARNRLTGGLSSWLGRGNVARGSFPVLFQIVNKDSWGFTKLVNTYFLNRVVDEAYPGKEETKLTINKISLVERLSMSVINEKNADTIADAGENLIKIVMSPKQQVSVGALWDTYNVIWGLMEQARTTFDITAQLIAFLNSPKHTKGKSVIINLDWKDPYSFSTAWHLTFEDVEIGGFANLTY